MLHKKDGGIRYSVQINWGCCSVPKNILPLAECSIIWSEMVREWIRGGQTEQSTPCWKPGCCWSFKEARRHLLPWEGVGQPAETLVHQFLESRSVDIL